MKKTTLMWLGIALGLCLCAFVCWASFDPPALEGVKAIDIYVYDEDGNYTHHETETTAQYLLEAVNDLQLVTCEETPSGLLIQTVEDMTPAEGSVWVYNVNSELSELTLDEQPVEDGDMFAFYQSDLSPAPEEDGSDLPPEEEPFDWQKALEGTWLARDDSGETIVISEYRVRLVGVTSIPYELTFTEDGTDSVYLILNSKDGEVLGTYFRLTALREGDSVTLTAETLGDDRIFEKSKK